MAHLHIVLRSIIDDVLEKCPLFVHYAKQNNIVNALKWKRHPIVEKVFKKSFYEDHAYVPGRFVFYMEMRKMELSGDLIYWNSCPYAEAPNIQAKISDLTNFLKRTQLILRYITANELMENKDWRDFYVKAKGEGYGGLHESLCSRIREWVEAETYCKQQLVKDL
jgi:hypothetical protein